jgi:two-component system nitrogen regulation response regulator GlnG/two-component system response regulator HydG
MPAVSDETTADLGTASNEGVTKLRDVPALVIAWSAEEPERVGEIGLMHGKREPMVLGRGDGTDEQARMRFFAQRPDEPLKLRPIQGKGISRDQLEIARDGAGLRFVRIGKCRTLRNGARADEGRLDAGDTLLLDKQLLLLCARRPPLMAPRRTFPDAEVGVFGAADGLGIIGESVAIWRLREQIAFSAQADKHVLVLGPSGSGKELAGRAIHGLSPRRKGPWVARNAATMPEGVIDAELFGNRKDYPNPGMPEREGLIGSADGGTLFLDEIGELSEPLQARLLRVMDAGEYQRLGDDRTRRADLRVVAATNRDVEALKFDVAARLTLQLETPGLNERREDIPLLARHLVRKAAQTSPAAAGRFVDGGRVHIAPALVDALVRHRYTLHVRELDRLLWRAMAGATGDALERSPEVDALLEEDATQAATPRLPPDVDAVEAALAKTGGNQTAAAKLLGMSSRYALYRLMKKHGISADG